VVGAYGGLFLSISLFWNHWHRLPFVDVAHPFLLSLAYGFVSSIGWQWTGDDRLGPGFLRGLAQALVVSAGVLILEAAWYRLASGLRGAGLRSFLTFEFLLHLPLMALVGRFIAQAEQTETAHREAQAQVREAQWSLWRSQLSPHFLFNAISAFVELGRRDWPATERGLLALAEVYRALLASSERPESTLGEERALVANYLEVEALRLGPRLAVEWDWDRSLDAEGVPSLVLLPLVENAVKHGLEPTASGGRVRISLRREGSIRILEVANTGAWGEPPKRSHAVGLRNLQARLKLAYAGRATLNLARSGDWTRATLHLPSA
jgi:hypothetical protein